MREKVRTPERITAVITRDGEKTIIHERGKIRWLRLLKRLFSGGLLK